MSVTGATLPDDRTPPSPSFEEAHPLLTSVHRLPGQILVSWTLAGGLVAAGFLVAATTLTGRTSSSSVPDMSLLLFGLGASAGLAHGGLLGYICHDPARTRLQVVRTLSRAFLWLVPGLLLTWAAALWISLTAAVLEASNPTAFRVGWIVLAWLYGVLVCGWAAWAGLRGVVAALRRWPDVRIASIVMSAAFAILVTRFLSSPPEIWFTHLRVTTVGAVILAFGASVWITLPVMIGGLGLMHYVFRKN